MNIIKSGGQFSGEKVGSFQAKKTPGLTIAHIIVTIILYIISLLASIKIGDYFSLTTRDIWFIGIILIIVIWFLSNSIYKKLNKRIPSFQRLESFDYEILEKEISHQYVSMEHILHIRKCKVRALRNGLGTFVDKFKWTGDNFKIRTEIPGDSVLMVGQRNIFNEYEYKFHKKLKKNEVIDMEVIWELDNSSLNACPFFSTTIEEPTKKLNMILKLPPNLGVTKANCETSGTKGAQKPYDCSEVSLNRKGEYIWTIKDPKILHHYEINWNFL